ncbi:hypothetical protein [Streptomyces laculatispora]|uniref:hypothetical protein n=1 Tax=Streptomyces laculatispora TaxID=887464 RepID=UPI001A949FF4|nr:hypothetical protein [Streptomyces laculatispora]MBO0917487.1 hypothetical protein [Streptomyces laculatispora]
MTKTPRGASDGRVEALRLLPWSNPEGRPCYVSGDGTGYVSLLADEMESLQLSMCVDLLDHADDMIANRATTGDQLRFLAARMTESLRDVHRIARSRGLRLGGQGGEPGHVGSVTV